MSSNEPKDAKKASPSQQVEQQQGETKGCEQQDQLLRIQELEQKLTQMQVELKDVQLRAQADIENVRRRCEADVEKAYKFSIERFANALLPVIDSLERAQDLADKENPALKAMMEGIELTHKSMLDTVKKFGVDVVAEANVAFNPDVHQAMSMIESDEIAPNHVVTVVQHGYQLNGRLLRPAMVIVAKENIKQA